MKKDLVTDIRKMIVQEYKEDATEAEFFAKQSAKLKKLMKDELENYEGDRRKEIEDTINSYLNGSKTQKRKLLSFCMNFDDPTVQKKIKVQNCGVIQLNAFLQTDELNQIYQFVKRHESDNTFGETVYRIMDDHNMKQSDLYKAAYLRRQDFSRATNPKAANVTKRLVWQIIIGLHCTLEEADELLFSAGYIRRRNKFDLTMRYFIERKNYDIFAINEALYELGLKAFSCYRPVKDKDNR